MLVSDKLPSHSKDENRDCVSSQMASTTVNEEKKNAVENCLTSLLYKNVDFDLGSVSECIADETGGDQCFAKKKKVNVAKSSQ